jgi:hypothetical protein
MWTTFKSMDELRNDKSVALVMGGASEGLNSLFNASL